MRRTQVTAGGSADRVVADARRIAKGTGIGLVGGAATYAFILGYTFVCLQALGTSGLGLLALATVVNMLVSETADLGMDFGLIRYATVWIDRGRPEVARGLMWGALRRVAVGATLYALTLEAVSGPLLGDLIGQPKAVTALRTLAVGIPLSALTDILVAALKARQTVVESSMILQFVGPGTRFGLALAAWATGGGIETFAMTYVLAEALTFLIAFAITYRIVLVGPSVRDAQELSAMARYSLPLSLNRALLYSNNQTEILLLGVFGTPEMVGVFQVCIQLALVTSAILAAIGAIFSPVVAAAFGNDDRPRIQSLYQLSTRWSLMVGLPLFLFVIGHAALITQTLDIHDGAKALVILSFGRLVDLATGTVAAVLMVAGHARLSLMNSLLFLGLSLGFDALLIPRYGLTGAACASALSLVIINVVRVAQVWHYLHIQPVQRELARVVVAAVIAAVPTLLVPDLSMPRLSEVIVLFGLLVAVYVPLVLLLVVDETDRAVLEGIVRRVRPARA
ncbi:MAG TPA: oligosaccharide flippase family protein [Gaiellales bacterium]|nr:oligosaccharide flippase family protein [Gaiellales bacterium]